METLRRQLTLFVNAVDASLLEDVRSRFNATQRHLIDAHVTLCREDEIKDLDAVMDRLSRLTHQSITISFGPLTRFDQGKGLMLPSGGDNEAYHHLRRILLHGLVDPIRKPEPHLTLMHPRNSSCTDEIFDQLKTMDFPEHLNFKRVSLIEQKNGEAWSVLAHFDLMP